MTQAGLMSLVIDQSPERQARFAVDVLRQHFGHELASPVQSRPTGNTGFTLHGPCNLET